MTLSTIVQVFLVEESREYHPTCSKSLTNVSHNVVSSTPRHEQDSNSIRTGCIEDSCKSNYHTIKTTRKLFSVWCHFFFYYVELYFSIINISSEASTDVCFLYRFCIEWVSDCCLTPIKKNSATLYIMARRS